MEILVDIAPDVYGPYVHENKKGEKVLLVQCMNALCMGLWSVRRSCPKKVIFLNGPKIISEYSILQ